MTKSSNKKITRKDIIGLGEASFKKNYYPELQEKILELEKINSRNSSLIRGIPDIILYYDEHTFITEYNLPQDQDIIDLILNNRSIYNQLEKKCEWVKENEKLEVINFSMIINGENRFYEGRIYLTQIKEIFIIIRDNTEKIKLQAKLRNMALRDSLTQIHNRRYFENKLEIYNDRPLKGFALIIFDIDGLKIVNDTLGHFTGDEMIKSAANMIKNHFTKADHLARIGGDEFGLIYKKIDYNYVQDRLFEFDVLLEDFNTSDTIYELSMSYGYSFNNKGKVDVNHLYKQADNKMYQRKLLKESSMRHTLVKTLMKALEERDYITEGHAHRMGETAAMIGNKINLSISSINRLKLLSKFHDIGKVGIPDKILNKPGPLNEKEWEIMKTHCEIGFRIANESAELRDIADLILKHQEKYDGSGYPLGLKEEEIPIECRIISVVDAFDAMTNDRPYRKGMSIERAIDELEEYSGTQFDPKIVEVFINIFSS